MKHNYIPTFMTYGRARAGCGIKMIISPVHSDRISPANLGQLELSTKFHEIFHMKALLCFHTYESLDTIMLNKTDV